MNNLDKELHEIVKYGLHELAWARNYPINPFVALHSFFEAFKESGFNVIIDDKHRIASFSLNYEGRLLETSLTCEKILTGWKHQPKSSPHSLYNSICIIYDNFGDLL